MTHYILVACVAQKSGGPRPAKDLFVSLWFTKARAYAEGQDAGWYVLSAKHGLLRPDAVIGPYDVTLSP